MSGFFANNIEEAVLAGCRKGDNAAHAQLFAAFSTAVFTLALRLTGSRPVADEVVQDTFIEVLTKIGQYRGDAPIGAWVRRIAVNKALAQLRSPWHKRGESLVPDLETCDIDQSVSLDLSACLQHLGPTARSVLWLHDVEGYTHKEIAAFMEKTVSFSKSQLSRAHQKLNAWAVAEQAGSKPVTKTARTKVKIASTLISSKPKLTVS
ncbi:MAG: RNA polymerase sigma factor [Gammaproteobacteria bacterium]